MSPFDAAWRLLKEDPLDPEERTPVDDEKIQYKFPSAGPYWTLNDRQKKVADAALDLPSEYLSEEGWSGYDFNHLFADGHETVPDQEYDRLEAALRYFKSYIKDHMADPDSDKSPQFLESWDDPRHPWAMARNMAFYREIEPYDHFSEDFKEANKSEPMDIAWRLLKMKMEPGAIRPTRKKPPGTMDAERQKYLDEIIQRERDMSLEEYRNEILDEVHNRNFAFRTFGGQSRLPGYKEHFITTNRKRGRDGVNDDLFNLKPAFGMERSKRFRGNKVPEDRERKRIANTAPDRPKPKTRPARLHMGVSHERGRDFFLQDEEGNPLATIEGSERYKFPVEGLGQGRNIRGFSGSSQEKRRGHYRDLIESLLRHGFTLRSESRNKMSNPFHRKFLRTLPDDIRAKIDAEQGKLDVGPVDPIRYEAHAPFSRTKDLDYGDLVVETRSKYPMTYDTPYQGYKRRLEEGIGPLRDIIVPAHIVRDGDKFEAVPKKQYFQSRLAGTGFNPSKWFDGITTREGIVVPRRMNLNNIHYTPFVQTGGAINMETMPSAQRMMDFGIDPMTRMRQRVGVVDSGAPRLDEYGGQS